MAYTCPLCGQPVSAVLYRKILGIERHRKREIQQAVRLANIKAEKQFKARLNLFKKQIRASTKDQLKRERELGAQEVDVRYKRLNQTFHSTLSQMKTQSNQIQKQQSRITELEKQLERQTTPQIEGLLYENNLIRELKKRFPEDQFKHTGKGGDIIQTVMRKDDKAGAIVYECKRVKNYSKSHVKQAFDAMRKRKADFAVLVTNTMKKGTQGFFIERTVMVVHATGVLSLASVLRGQIVQIAEMKLGQLHRNKAIKLVLGYLEGPEFANSLDTIIHENISLYEDLKKEIKEHMARWKTRYRSYKRVYEEALTVKGTSKALLTGEAEAKRIAPKGTLPALVELPEVGKQRHL